MRGQVRIIGGIWRGRKLKIPPIKEVKPTPDRVRETLFNWLAPVIVDAHCLDLFAGSGALGFEALSRGAASVVMVDQAAKVITTLKEAVTLFKAENAIVIKANLPHEWPNFNKKFNIVFLDPPYQENILFPVCFLLEEKKLLEDNAYIYMESGKTIAGENLPSNWEIIKCKKAGQVNYYLLKRSQT